MAVITANNRNVQSQVAPAPALREDGTNYEWRMSFSGNSQLADTDDVSEFIAILFDPEYLALKSEKDRLEARKSYARRIQLEARSRVIASLDDSDSEKIEDWEWDVLTYGGESSTLNPFGWGQGDGELGVNNPEQIDVWNNDVPLVLLSTSYYPHTDIAAPLSGEGDYRYVKNIIWIRPETELEFLRSLSHIGWITFGKPQAAPRANAKARDN